MSKSIISADSHVTEHPDAYVSRVDQKYKDRVPHKVYDDKMGDLMVIEGRRPVVLSLASAAGENPKDLLTKRGDQARFEVLPQGGWNPDARVEAQKRDGVDGEVLYPTIGMEICNLQDLELKKVCMDAYNLWVAEFAASKPNRLFGLGQTPMRDIDESIEDLKKIKALGLVGVMLPGLPGIADEDYDSPVFDPFWQAAVDLAPPRPQRLGMMASFLFVPAPRSRWRGRGATRPPCVPWRAPAALAAISRSPLAAPIRGSRRGALGDDTSLSW